MINVTSSARAPKGPAPSFLLAGRSCLRVAGTGPNHQPSTRTHHEQVFSEVIVEFQSQVSCPSRPKPREEPQAVRGACGLELDEPFFSLLLQLLSTLKGFSSCLNLPCCKYSCLPLRTTHHPLYSHLLCIRDY